MRTAAFRKAVPGRQTSHEFSLPAPTGGWNARDSIADMDEKDAVTLENFFAETTDVRVRSGMADHVTGIGAQVESLMAYSTPAGTKTLFCAASNEFYDVTTAGAVGAAVVTGLANNRWQHVNYTNAGGTSYLCCFNGADDPRYWDGSTWTAITGVSSPAITGVTPTNIIGAAIHNRRMWLVEKDSLTAWYLPIDSVGGTARAFSLAGMCKRGGFIMAIGTWTLDSGIGIDDLLVIITSEGQVVVFKGTDPSSASAWSLIGIWDIGAPLGRRCMTKYKGDNIIACVDGVMPLSTALIGSRADPQAALTYKINRAFAIAALSHKDKFGWEIFHYPLENHLMLNVPVNEGSSQEQYAMNTITGSWGRYKGLAANCWAVCNNEAYYGTDGEVVKFGGLVYADNSTNINTDLQQAYSYFGHRGRIKQFIAMRPNILLGGSISLKMDVTTDFGIETPQNSLSLTPAQSAVWDGASSKWDDTSLLWGGGVQLSNPWQTVNGVGIAGSPRMLTASQTEVRLQSSDYVFEFGGVIAAISSVAVVLSVAMACNSSYLLAALA
jgi:hypothetical protein